MYIQELQSFCSEFGDKLKAMFLPHDANDQKQLLYPLFGSVIQSAYRKTSVHSGIGIINALFSSGRLKIHSGCKELIREIFLYSYEEKEDQEDKVLKQNDHSCDALRYCIISSNVLSLKDKKFDVLLEETFQP